MLTFEEFGALPEDGYWRDELSRGRLVREPPPGYEHGSVVARIAHLLSKYVDAHPGSGRVVAESGFVLEEAPATVRAPDVAFIRTGRNEPERGYFRGAADIAVEVVSPFSRASDLQEKVLQYLDAGAQLVWVVYPETRTVVEHRSRSDIALLRESETLTTPLLPGFEVRVAALFD
ncbi:MAG: Uma2 family endonuclease [Gemmatimonadota bacterium]